MSDDLIDNVNRVKNRTAFAVIPAEIIEDMRISPQALRIYCYMRSKTGCWQFYNKDIMTKLNISSAHSMAKYLAELIDSGWIKRTEKIRDGGGFAGYEYEVIETKQEEIITEVKIHKGNQPELRELRMLNNDNREEVDRMSNNDKHSSSINNNIYKKEKNIKKEKKILNLDFIANNNALKNVFQKYFDYRQKIKRFKTQHGVAARFNDLCKLSNNNPAIAEQIVDRTIANEWINIYSLQSGIDGRYAKNIPDGKYDSLVKK